MLQRQVEKEVDKVLAEKLSPYGYEYNKKDDRFYLKKGNFTYYISYSLVNKRPQYIIELYFGIRNEQVEDIANKFSGVSPDYCNSTRTMIAPFSYFKREWIEFVVTDSNDIEKIGDFVAEFYPSVVEPFIEQHASSLEQLSPLIDKIIIDDDEFVTIPFSLYQKDIILLKLTNNPAFETRVKEIRKIIEEYPEVDKKCFEDTYKYLKTL